MIKHTFIEIPDRAMKRFEITVGKTTNGELDMMALSAVDGIIELIIKATSENRNAIDISLIRKQFEAAYYINGIKIEIEDKTDRKVKFSGVLSDSEMVEKFTRDVRKLSDASITRIVKEAEKVMEEVNG